MLSMKKKRLGDDPLVLIGFAIEAARHLHRRCPTKGEVEALRKELAEQEDTLSDEDRRQYREIGLLDPQPVIQQMRRAVAEESPDDLPGLLDRLELILALRRYGGRPKGKRQKITPAQVEAIRRWHEGRNRRSRPTAAEFAKEQGLSRQTIYTIIAELNKERSV
jgi:hypothetical protein